MILKVLLFFENLNLYLILVCEMNTKTGHSIAYTTAHNCKEIYKELKSFN